MTAVYSIKRANYPVMALYRMPGIVLRTYPFQEAHLIVTILSPTKGKIRAIAKGARRLQSVLSRLVQPMIYGVFQLAEGKNLDVLSQGVLKSVFPKTRGDLEKLTHGLYALELIDRLIEEPEAQPNVFFILLKTLEGLEAGKPAPALLRAFEAHLFRLLGYAPQLDRCLGCGTGNFAAASVKFSSRLGGILCEKCAGQDKLAHRLKPGVLAALQECFEIPPGEVPELGAAMLGEVSPIFQHFLREKCGKKMHGFELLEQVGSL